MQNTTDGEDYQDGIQFTDAMDAMTTCTQPNRFADWEFEALLDDPGHAEHVELARHLQRCTHCAAKLLSMQTEATQLETRLSRIDCPPSETLQRHRWGVLNPDQAQTVMDHLRTCTACTTELAQFLGPLRVGQSTQSVPQAEAGSLTQTIRQQVKIIMAKLLPSDPSAMPALRGSSDLDLLSYSMDEIGWELVLQVQSEPAGFVLSGQLFSPEIEGLQTAQATLLRQDNFVGEARLDETGWFDLRVAEPGHYRIAVEMRDCRICADVDVGKS